MARLAPTRAQLNTFHGFCVDFARRTGHEPDFSTPGVFDALVQQFSQAEVPDAACVDLLIIDEAQDFDPTWIQALLNRLAVGGRAYMLSDANQDLYAREEFDIPDAVQVRCMDNFRSPHRIVQTINQLGLCQDRVRACSAAEGETPGFHTYPVQTEPRLAKKVNTAQHCLNTCLSDLWRQGVVPDDVVVLSFAGIKQSAVLQAGQSASPFVRDHALRVFTGQYDSAGNEVWTQGDLKAESIYRFKGQSAPVVVLCEVDFPAITDKVLHKLFVGFTRAQLRLEVVLSEQAATLLLARGE
jgi:superfamily I DNA and RNA helicase